jgi:MFS family permease
MPESNKITQWLSRQPTFGFALYASFSAFCLYTSIFALRKAFGVADYGMYQGINFKALMAISQVLGYMLSKFIGIKVVSELNPSSRAKGILMMTGMASLAWFFFAITPAPYSLIFLFLNGLPLGMVWGMVFGYMEGRKTTEVLGAALSVSFIFSSGFAKTMGGMLMANWGVTELWMPFATCVLFFPPLLLFLFLLNKIPPPTAEDEMLRTKRQPMTGEERKKFTLMFLPGLVLLVLAYMLLTAYRDFRDNFSAEIWRSLGIIDPKIFTKTETLVSLVVLIVIASLMVIRNNFEALVINHIIVIIGMLMVGVGSWLFEQKLIDAPTWMVAVGMGLYFGYIQFNSIFFDRLIATFKYVSTVGFLIYLADSFGYVGSVGVMFYKEFGSHNLSWLDFFLKSSYILSISGTVLMLASLVYFVAKNKSVRALNHPSL